MMKTTFSILFAVFFIQHLFAQETASKMLLTFDANYHQTSEPAGSNSSENTTHYTFNLNPKLGYHVSPKFVLGVQLQNTWGKKGSNYIINNEQIDSKVNSLLYGLFSQYNLYQTDKLVVFAEWNGVHGKTTSNPMKSNVANIELTKEEIKIFNSSLGAGVRYYFCKNFGMEARMNNIVQYDHKSYNTDNPTNSQFSVLNNILKHATIGFAFRF